MLFGVIGQSLPDIDFITSFYLSTPEQLLAHRGFTHSLLFAALATILAAKCAKQWYRQSVPIRTWIFLFGLNIFSHIFIDAFNAYGTGWFEPFSHYRVSFHTIYVADPFFSFIPFVAFLVLMVLHQYHRRRRLWVRLAIGYLGFYILYACINKFIITQQVYNQLSEEGIEYTETLITPAPLNNWLWYVVAKGDSGVYTGYRSVFGHKQQGSFQYFPKNNHLLDEAPDPKNLPYLLRFSQGYYTVEHWGDTLVFNDLRFGQIVGWHNPKERFAFHYFLSHPQGNKLVVQRGRFAKWNHTTITSLIQKIKGK